MMYHVTRYTDLIKAFFTFKTSYLVKYTCKCDIIYARKGSTTFPVPRARNLDILHKHYVHIC